MPTEPDDGHKITYLPLFMSQRCAQNWDQANQPKKVAAMDLLTTALDTYSRVFAGATALIDDIDTLKTKHNQSIYCEMVVPAVVEFSLA